MTEISIDSSKIDEVVITISKGQDVITEVKQAKNIRGSQVILQTIDEILKRKEVTLTDVDAISAHSGPGSYTGLRVGASIANILAFCLEIPINQKPHGEFVYPSYE